METNKTYSAGASFDQDSRNEGVDIKDILSKCISRWYWFAASVLLCLFIAGVKILKTQPVFTRTATLMIKEDKRGRSAASIQDSFSDLGFLHNSSKTANEIMAFKAVSNMRDVVSRLSLDYNYSYDARFRPVVLYGPTLPFVVQALDEPDAAVFSFQMDIGGAPDAMVLHSFRDRRGDKLKGAKYTVALGDTLQTEVGRLVVTANPGFNPANDIPYATINVRKGSVKGTASGYSHRLTVALEDKMADVIRLTCNDVNPVRAEDVLNAVIAVYNEKWVNDKNQITVSTSMFIGDRLKVIEKELSGVEENIANFKSQNLLADVKETARLDLGNSNALSIQIQDLSNQLYMAKYISGTLSQTSGYQMLPMNSGLQNSNINQLISEYNSVVLNYNGIVSNSSAENPIAKDMEEQLKSMSTAIRQSLDNHILALNTQISALQRNLDNADSRIARNPSQAKDLLSEERQQSVKEAIYLFLLQKREENELSQAFTAYNTRILDTPTGPGTPVAPNKKMIMLVAFLIGLAIPAGIIYLMDVINTTIRGKADLKALTAPFLGEIPLNAHTRAERRSLKQTSERVNRILVQHGNRDAVNEAFRVLRTNLEFMTKDKDSNVIMVTSFNPSSGKSFISANTAVSLAIKGLKVLIVDADLRKASSSLLVGNPDKGLSNYLSGQTDDIDAICCQVEGYEGLSMIPVGTIPPNPSELISSPRFEELLSSLRTRYDYVFLDCPPIDIVADSSIVGKLVDRTIFVVRVGLLERSLVPELESIYKEQRFKNLAVVLNGAVGSGRYGSRYGYHYGYAGRYGYAGHYGYGSGSYGYAGTKDAKTADKGWKVRLKNSRLGGDAE